MRIAHSKGLFSVALLALVAFGGCGGDEEPAGEGGQTPNTLAEHLPIGAGYNVVVISFDALRRDALGTYGYARPTSPRIDGFASESLVFENAVVAGKDTPTSFASAFTAELPFRVFRGWKLQSVPTLAGLFADAGYHTAGIMHNVQLAPERGFGQGFEHYEQVESRKDDKVVLERLQAWLDDAPQQPFLLWVHFISPHTPYVYRDFAADFYDPDYEGPFSKSAPAKLEASDAPTAADRQRVRDLYDGEVLFADRLFGQVREMLSAAGVWDNSVVVLTSDHGEAFLEHGEFGHDYVYQEVLEVPLIVRHPGAGEPGRTDMPVSNVDLLPTLATLLEVPHPDYMDGVSLVSSPWADRPIISMAMTSKDKRAFAMRVGEDKLIAFCGRSSSIERLELYDLATDPGETTNLSDTRVETVKLLLGHLRDQAGERPCRTLKEAVQGKSIEEGLDEERIEQLRSLGYIQ